MFVFEVVRQHAKESGVIRTVFVLERQLHERCLIRNKCNDSNPRRLVGSVSLPGIAVDQHARVPWRDLSSSTKVEEEKEDEENNTEDA